jgi:predicted AAA+ superfamily ATPase
LKTYIEKDVRQLVNNELKFMKYLTALAARCGELLNFHAIANEVEISIDTVKQWFQYYRYQVLFFAGALF